MSSEAETQQAPQPAVDEEGPSSPAAAASAGDKKVIGKELEISLLARIANGLWGPAEDRIGGILLNTAILSPFLVWFTLII